MKDFLKIDLHVHTTASHDGLITAKAAVRRAIKKGLDGIAVADHNTTDAIQAVKSAAPDGFIVIPAVEYSTDCGHVLAFFCEDFAKEINRDEKGRFYLEELSPFIRERGGVLVAAHPFSGRAELPQKLFSLVDGLESVNSRELARNSNSRTLVENEAKKYGLFTTGGSDAHLPGELGGAYTQFPQGVNLRTALLQGKCTVQGKRGADIYRIISKCYRRLKNWR